MKKITPKQREFIEKLFKNGTLSKVKLSAEQMADQMKDEMVDGNYYFSPIEYLDAKRIRNIIAGLRKKENSSSIAATPLSEDDSIEENLDEICESVLSSVEDDDFFGFDVHDI